MEDREVQKRELIVVRYEKLKKKVKDWENALYRTEGRKPTSNDMKYAPKDVQESYREYMKLRKYLSNEGNFPVVSKSSKQVTPGKIFLNTKRPELQKGSKVSYLVRTPNKMFKRSDLSRNKTAATPTNSLGLRSMKPSSGLSDNSTTDSSSIQQPFKRLFQFSRDTQVTASSSSKLLNPTSSTEQNNQQPSTSSGVLNKPMEPENDLLFPIDPVNNENVVNKPVKCSKFAKSNNEDNFLNDDETMESFETVPLPSLKSPRANGKQGCRSTVVVDAGWLARVNTDDDELMESDHADTLQTLKDDAHPGPGNTSGESEDLGMPNSPSVDKANHSHESIPCDDNENMAMEVEAEDHLFYNPVAVISNIIDENTDSGICVNRMFNANEFNQALKEVMEETKTGETTSAVTSNSTQLYTICEDACLPSDHEEGALDSNTMSHILKVLSENIDEEKCQEDSNSTHASPSHIDSNAVPPNRKRPRFIFDSPKKSTKPRKFFKSDRGDRKRPAYSPSLSYGPLSPLKQLTKKNGLRTPSSGLTSAASKLVNKSKKRILNYDEEPGSSKSVVEGGSPGNRANIKKTLKKIDNKLGRDHRKKINYIESDEDESANRKAKLTQTRQNTVIDCFNEAETVGTETTKMKGKKIGGKFRRNESLESKIQSGKLDDNYVRIDTKRKVFVRGHRKISVTKLKRLDWKNRKMGKDVKSDMSTFTCHKCGEKGHFAKFCMKDVSANAASDDIPQNQQDDSPFPTLEEAAMMVYKGAVSNRVNVHYTSKNNGQIDETQGNEEKESQLSENPILVEPVTTLLPASQLITSVDPIFSDEFLMDPDFEEETMLEGLRAFGYDGFRPGQKEAVFRVLKGLSTLLILSTGSGKSLCYQLPAYLYAKKHPDALTLCISPLVSLMEDQIQGMPAFLNAGCLHSNMTPKQKNIVLEKLKSKQLNILLVSPEAVCGGLFGILRGNSDTMPKISFACIDEVHCVSQWSHNFRPSYLQLCKILREQLNVKTILGLTATATKTTVESICEHLSIDPSTTIRGELIPKNLHLSVSRDLYKDEALMNLLRGERFCNCDSIIIYCTRREECERISIFVRTKLQEIGNRFIKTKSGARLSASCEAYHAGMSARRRKNVQEGFMSGAIRVVVATVAFGMGIDKSDIRAIIHYNMPSAFESYVQEIGRAGRDGLPAQCHLFLDNAKRSDLCELKRHVYANSVDRPTVRRLLRKVFQTCKCKRIQELKGISTTGKKIPCEGHEVSFSIEKAVTDLDLPKENITTLLCYLELGQKKWIEMLPLTYQTCRIQSYGGPKMLKSAAARCPPLAVAVALQKEKKEFFDTDTFIEFNVIEAAATVGWNSSVVKKELKNLEWIGSQYDDQGTATRFRKSGLMVEFNDLAYRLKSQGSLSDEDADCVLNYLHGRNVNQEQIQLHQLNRVYHALLSVSFPNMDNLCDKYDEGKSDQLKTFIHEYFSEEVVNSIVDTSNFDDISMDSDKAEDLRRSIRSLIDSNKDTDFTTRAIARIFQGISSPNFPSDVWYKSRDFWRRYLDVDFHFICRVAAEEL